VKATVASQDVESVLDWIDEHDPECERFIYVGSADGKMILDIADPVDVWKLKLEFTGTIFSA
jgi:hypothetical protein